ncbi:LacI family transcriptional regulator [Aliiruegeria haliotis]|uniref:LacI family transcriptional regulator n=1 Tax=Aliiruegeria haliotis TaxID=1280846 RepID=A0A2T0RIB3_9RHOB|nr:LacI family DNA-binding transcriptional regulator [Aliiruegeria haliotis]PRY20867.1 LacI family transcriptional regulator [Aliiruegeria haliotis]
MAQRVTIKSIAQDLGISHMTVSRALTNHPSVRAETRKAILERARELGYVKSAAATAMRGDATGIIGLLLPNIVNEFYARFANALALACEPHGIQVITHLTNDDQKREAHALLRLREVQADSVVLVPAPGEPDVVTNRYLEDMQVVQLIRQRTGLPEAACLLLEDVTAIGAAVDRLAANGHDRIAYIGAHTALSSGRERLSAFRNAMRRNGMEPLPELVQTSPPSFEMGRRSAGRILHGPEAATALVCGGFEISNGALETCLRHGVNFPEGLAFIGYGDPSFYEWIQGGISTVSLPVDDLARCTAELLSRGQTEDHKTVSLPAELIIRSSG